MVQSWFNADQLLIRFGPDASGPAVAGEYRMPGELREIEVVLDLTTLTSSSAILDDVTFFPKSVFVEEVVLDVQTAATSAGSPTLDVGLMQTDRSTQTSNTSFIAAEVLSGVLDTAGKKIIYTAGVSKAGAAIGTTTSQVNYITARANTATFTAGKVIIRIKYRRAL